MKKLIYLLTAVVLALNFSCKDSGTGPEEKKSVRDYTWTADTLAYPGSSQTLMRSIWGSSATDIYVCGHNSGSDGSLWHYNGNKWLDIKLYDYIQRGSLTLNSVHGTASDDVWAVGYRITGDNPNPPPNFIYQSLILHYNGITWKEENVKTKSAVYSIYANTENDVWACGSEGIVYYYDGVKWELDTLEVSINENETLQLNNINSYDNQVYIIGSKGTSQSNQTIFYYVKKSAQGLEIIDTSKGYSTFKWGVSGLYTTLTERLFSYGWGIYEWDGANWEIRKDLTEPIRDMYSTADNNILAVGDFGNVLHFNGNDWQILDKLKNIAPLYSAVWMDGNKVFIIGQLLDEFPQTTIVLHGQ